MNQKLKKQLEKITPTFNKYYETKNLIKLYEQNLENNKDLLNKIFYVQQDFNFYSFGTFGGWDKNGNFLLKIKDPIKIVKTIT
jgi:hypothetical protein